MVVALFAHLLEVWIRWAAPCYVVTMTVRKPDYCVHPSSDSVVDQATYLRSPGLRERLCAACRLSPVAVSLPCFTRVFAKPTQN